MSKGGLPEQQGLYDPRMEKDSCGVGFIANINGEKSFDILCKALDILKSLKHRGAVGADATTGDGSGVLFQIPHQFLDEETPFSLPDEGDYAVGMIFLPRQPNARLFCEGVMERVVREEGQKLLGWREVPVNEYECGDSARATRPVVAQIFIDGTGQDQEAFERKLLVIRKRTQKEILDSNKPYVDAFYVCSLSSKTMVYKGQILGYKLERFYTDLQDDRINTSIAVVHERYSTNTFPSWKLAQPFRYLAHNGEINTITGNIHWMNAREGVMHSDLFGADFQKTLPIVEPDGSDSSALDNVLELFVSNNHSIENSLMMLVPEAWQKDERMGEDKRSFYEYHARVMEPWDGPATIAFTDGVKVGVAVDRNGLRPARYVRTQDGLVIMASEIGVVNVPEESVVEKGCVQPGKLLMIDTKEGRIIPDEELKNTASTRLPFHKWVQENRISIDDLAQINEASKMDHQTLRRNHVVFGYNEEEMKRVIAYMAESGKEPIGSMGIDIPLAVLSDKSQLLFNYFKQKFAQVTNPSIDPIREDSIMSLAQFVGSHGRLLDKIEIDKNGKYIRLEHPILTNQQLGNLRNQDNTDFRAITIPMVFQADHEENGIKEALDNLCRRAEENVKLGYNILILSDRNIDMYNAPIPSLLALGAVHHHLVRRKLRTAVDIVMETGDARDVMHVALLVGYGAKAVNPYMAFEIIKYLSESEKINVGVNQAYKNYINAICGGLMKIISRMGISTLQSYCGAQIFEAVGVNRDVIDTCFTDTPALISGLGLEEIAAEVVDRQDTAYHEIQRMGSGSEIYWNNDKESHFFNAEVVSTLRRACVENDVQLYHQFAKEANEENEKSGTIRGLLKFKERKTIPLAQVEPIDNIMRRFRVSGMSFGSLSIEAHETIAVAANSIGAASNSGEGGEDPARYELVDGAAIRRSEVKQVASGRFGVTANYLVNCREIEIKVAQGAKPGEGGHLPGGKVTADIAMVRHSEPGIDLVSPPPHHDIYSIEDIAQLIFDLKNINPSARIGVKLVAQSGVGTVVTGVVKAHADAVLVSGHDGGTGASPLSSMKYVGLPWELGLAETQQTLLLNNLRSRVRIQVDGKLKTGRDVVIAALLGAEEYGFATSILIASGCRMCRRCHLNKCVAGIATQEEAFRSRFEGKPEHIANYFRFVAEEVREILAQLGVGTIDEIVGRVDLLAVVKANIKNAKNFDLTPVLYRPELPSRIEARCTMCQDHKLNNVLDHKLIADSMDSLERQTKTAHSYHITNMDRACGTMLSGEIARRFGDDGLPEDTINIFLEGSAGQSFGAFAAKGLTLVLEGDANDYLGKGLSGGRIVLYPPRKATFEASKNIIAGNTLLYGATSGEAFISGKAGQRFCVRNSGAVAVVEGVGDHGCQYMTGGVVVVIGKIGKNFGAGMSGGVAYVLDEKGKYADCFNRETVQAEQLVGAGDSAVVLELLQKHYLLTGSKKARKILDNWNQYAGKFLRVCSPQYKSQLERIV